MSTHKLLRIRQSPYVHTGEWMMDTDGQVRTIRTGISQVVSGTERTFSAVLDIEKSVLISVFFIDFPNTGTISKHTTPSRYQLSHAQLT